MTTPQTEILLPDWLPATIPFTGVWDTFVKALHLAFKRDFVDSAPRFQTRPVWHDRRVDREDLHCYEEGFWHLVTRDEWVYNTCKRKKEKRRLPETDRASRLPWARPIIEHYSEPVIQTWDFDADTKNGPVVRTYIWLKDHDYVVILERQTKNLGDIYMLITSFFVDSEYTRRDLESRYERRRKNAGPA